MADTSSSSSVAAPPDAVAAAVKRVKRTAAPVPASVVNALARVPPSSSGAAAAAAAAAAAVASSSSSAASTGLSLVPPPPKVLNWATIRSGLEETAAAAAMATAKSNGSYEPTAADVKSHLDLKLPLSRTVSQTFLDISQMSTVARDGAMSALHRFTMMLRQWAHCQNDPEDAMLGWECHRQLRQLACRWCRTPYVETDDFKNGTVSGKAFLRIKFDLYMRLPGNELRRRVRESPGPHDMEPKPFKGDEFHVHDLLDAWEEWEAKAEICQVTDDVPLLKYLGSLEGLRPWLKEIAGRWSENMNFIRFADDEPKEVAEAEAAVESKTAAVPCTPSPKKQKKKKNKSKRKAKDSDAEEEEEAPKTPPGAPRKKKKLKALATPPASPAPSPAVAAAAASPAKPATAAAGGSPVKPLRKKIVIAEDD